MPPKPAEQPRNEQPERIEAAPESGVQPVESFELMSSKEALEDISRRAKEAEVQGKEARKDFELSKKDLASVAERYGVPLDQQAANDNAVIDAKADEALVLFKHELKEANKPAYKMDAKPKTEQDHETAAIDAGWDKIEENVGHASMEAEWEAIASEAPKEPTPSAAIESGIDKEATIEGSLMSMQDQMEYVQRVADAAPRPLETPTTAAAEAAPVVAETTVPESAPLQPAAPEAKPEAAAVDTARVAELQTQEQQLSAEYDRLAKEVAAEGENMSSEDKKAYKKALKTGDMSKLPKASVAEKKMNATLKKLNDLRAEKSALSAGQATGARAESRPAVAEPVAEARGQSAPEQNAPEATPTAAPEAAKDNNEALLRDLENAELLTLEADREADRKEFARLSSVEGDPLAAARRERLKKQLEAMDAAIDRKNAPDGLAKEIAKQQEYIDANIQRMSGASEADEATILRTIETLVSKINELKRRQQKGGPEKPPDTDPDPAGGKRIESAEVVDEVEPMMLEDDPRYNEMVDKKVRQLTAKGLNLQQAESDASVWAKTMFEKKFPGEAAQYEIAKARKEEKEGKKPQEKQNDAPDLPMAA